MYAVGMPICGCVHSNVVHRIYLLYFSENEVFLKLILLFRDDVVVVVKDRRRVDLTVDATLLYVAVQVRRLHIHLA